MSGSVTQAVRSCNHRISKTDKEMKSNSWRCVSKLEKPYPYTIQILENKASITSFSLTYITVWLFAHLC